MSPILKRSLIFITLMVAGLVIYMSWYNIKADRHNETAIPYLEKALPKLASWQYSELEPLLTPTARAVFSSEKVQAAYREFNRLGKLQSMSRPEFMGNRSENIDELGDVELIAYQVSLEFDSGPATVKINLASDGRYYYIHHFGFHSDIFADAKDGNQGQ